VLSDSEQACSDRQSLVRRGTVRGYLELGAAHDAECFLDQRARWRHEVIGHNRRDDEQVYILRAPTCRLERAPSRLLGHRRVGLTAGRIRWVDREVARFDARLREDALPQPLVEAVSVRTHDFAEALEIDGRAGKVGTRPGDAHGRWHYSCRMPTRID